QKIVAKIINAIRCQERLPEKIHYKEKIICMDNHHRDLSQILSSCVVEFYNSIDLYNTFRKNIGFENRKKNSDRNAKSRIRALWFFWIK
ncbi:hypothetical protein B6631_08860, partial [Campylobacter coli]|nr:hypothetical protein [Campylobacter coli]